MGEMMDAQLVDSAREFLATIFGFLPEPLRAWFAAIIITTVLCVAVMFATYKWGKKPNAEALYIQEQLDRAINNNKRYQDDIDRLREYKKDLRGQLNTSEDKCSKLRRDKDELEWQIINLRRELESEKKMNKYLGKNSNEIN